MLLNFEEIPQYVETGEERFKVVINMKSIVVLL